MIEDVSESNRIIGSQLKELQRTKYCGGLSERPEPYFRELYCYYKSSISSVQIFQNFAEEIAFQAELNPPLARYFPVTRGSFEFPN